MTEYLLCLQSETPLRKERRFYLGRIGGSLAGACPRAARRRLVLQNRFVFAEQCSALRDGGARRRRDLKRPYGEGRALSRIGGRPKVAPTGARRMKPRRARCPHRAADRRKPPSPRGGCPSAHTGAGGYGQRFSGSIPQSRREGQAPPLRCHPERSAAKSKDLFLRHRCKSEDLFLRYASRSRSRALMALSTRFLFRVQSGASRRGPGPSPVMR